MQLFYAPDITSEKSYVLTEEESTHCIAVLRYKEGQSITLTDGKGSFYEGTIERIAKKQITIAIKKIREVSGDRKYRLHIAIAPTKNIERFEWFLEKATEIGIDIITPLITDNSERKVIRVDRLEKIIIAAMKQSVKAYLPKLNPLTYFNEFVDGNYQGNQLLIAHCTEINRVLLQKVCIPGNDAIILIGPEGDFSPEEIQKANKNGYTSISLGNSRLRTETAGVVACHTVYILNQNND